MPIKRPTNYPEILGNTAHIIKDISRSPALELTRQVCQSPRLYLKDNRIKLPLKGVR